MMVSMFIKEILRGKSLIRTLMNMELRQYALAGRVLDIGGGVKPSYLRFFKKAEPVELVSLDFQSDGKSRNFDLEAAPLPYNNGSVDQVLLFNILEHIYNHSILMQEVYRVLKSGGQVFGFVPFLVGYHPDPHDYFRYTKESLERIFKESGFGHIEIKAVGGGPWMASFDMLMPYFPKIMRLAAFPFYFLFDKILLLLKPSLREKFPLGYLFILKKDNHYVGSR